LILLGITFIMFFVLRAVLNRRKGNDNTESKKYRDAVKQSQKKYGKTVTNKQIKKKNEKKIKYKKIKRKNKIKIKIYKYNINNKKKKNKKKIIIKKENKKKKIK